MHADDIHFETDELIEQLENIGTVFTSYRVQSYGPVAQSRHYADSRRKCR